jgi:hypothetical protein
MRATLLLLVALAAPALANQVVWKWVDKDGVTHYSDRPVPGATRLELSVGGGNQSAAPPRSSSDAPATQAAGPIYRNFEIISPSPNESLINTGGRVSVRIRFEPGLQPGHTLHLYMDGNAVEGFAPNAQDYDLTNVPRGTHTIAAVINNRGTRVQATPTVTFHVRQESTAQPPVGPNLRPPPKPQPRVLNKLPSSQPSYAALNGRRAIVDPVTNAPKVSKPAPVPPKQGG